jgi:hypothetical protein
MRAWMFSILLTASSALAAPPGVTPVTVTPPSATPPTQPTLTPVNIDEVPAACREIAQRADSATASHARSARVSLAICIAHEQSRAIAVCDCEDSVHQLDEAIAPAIALLDELVGGDDVAWQVVAIHTKGELYTELASRVFAAVPAVPPGSPEEAVSLHDLRVQLVQPLIQPWLERARDLFGEVERIAAQHPELAKNPTADAAVRDSRRRLAR